jgi:hypothetical protein
MRVPWPAASTITAATGAVPVVEALSAAAVPAKEGCSLAVTIP